MSCGRVGFDLILLTALYSAHFWEIEASGPMLMLLSPQRFTGPPSYPDPPQELATLAMRQQQRTPDSGEMITGQIALTSEFLQQNNKYSVEFRTLLVTAPSQDRIQWEIRGHWPTPLLVSLSIGIHVRIFCLLESVCVSVFFKVNQQSSACTCFCR